MLYLLSNFPFELNGLTPIKILGG